MESPSRDNCIETSESSTNKRREGRDAVFYRFAQFYMFDRDRFLDALRQQRLPSHPPPKSTPTCLLVFVFALGIFCVSIGVLLGHAANSIQEVRFDYTNLPIGQKLDPIEVNLTVFEGKEVYIYYEIEGFNQLHYSMRNAYDSEHFSAANYTYICTGESFRHRASHIFADALRNTQYNWLATLIKYTIPPRRVDLKEMVGKDAPVPCGERARFFFSDSILIFDENGDLVPFHNKNISWESDLQMFKNPDGFFEKNISERCSVFNDKLTGGLYPKPKRWTKHICNMEEGMQDQDFVVWMRPAYASTFRKLWKKLNSSSPRYENGLPNGTYTIQLDNNWWPWYNYTTGLRLPVPDDAKFSKTIVFSTVNWAGGKNNFLGLAYTFVGVAILFIGCVLAITQSLYPSYLHVESEEIRWRKNA